ncbi:hypothetical protein AMTRI_Chr01g133520 [Amborella trichopoda]
MYLKFSHLMPLSCCKKKIVQKELYAIFQINDERFIVRHYSKVEGGRTVTWKATEETLSCCCQQYEFSRILCRHAIRVLVAANVFQIPDKYILMRWRCESSLPCRNKVSNPIRCNERLRGVTDMLNALASKASKKE